jgi:hypothetical protein
MALGANKAALLGAAGSSTTSVHTIDQSIRFNDDDSPYMSRTQQAGNQTTWTISCWVKIGNIPGNFTIWSVHTGYQSYAQIRSIGGLEFAVGNGSSSASYHRLTRLLRDPSAWYHLVTVFDSTNAASSERARIYINGERQLDFSNTGSWAKDYASNVNSTQTMYIGEQGTGGNHMDGYIAEFVQIDGQALDPSNFAETNSSGIWVPKDVSGLTFGTNGCHIDGRDSSDLGDDESGNGNDFTTSGLAAHDQVSDSPTNNFSTLNSLDNRGNPGTLSEGNLKMAFVATNDNVTGTFGMSSGKWYWEAYIVDFNNTYLGVQDSGIAATGYTASAVALWYGGFIYENNSDTGDRAIATSGSAYTNGDVVGIAFDADNKKIWWSKNGQWYTANSSSTSTINISEVAAGNSAQVITRSPDFFMPFFGNYTHSTAIFNFGQEGTFSGNKTAGGNSDGNGVGNFFSAVPSGFLALCTKNLGS